MPLIVKGSNTSEALSSNPNPPSRTVFLSTHLISEILTNRKEVSRQLLAYKIILEMLTAQETHKHAVHEVYKVQWTCVHMTTYIIVTQPVQSICLSVYLSC